MKVLLTSPAPCITNTLSSSFFPVILREAKIPAAATAAVPVTKPILIINMD